MGATGLLWAALLGLGAGRLLHLASHCLSSWGSGSPTLKRPGLPGIIHFLWRKPPSLLEPAGALMAAGLWARFPYSELLWVYVPFVGLLLILTDLDLRYQWLPDLLTIPGIALGWSLALVMPHLSLAQAFWGAVAGGAIFQGIRSLYGFFARDSSKDLPQGLGGGDVKLLALIGAFLGLKTLPFILAVSSILGGITGLVLLLRKSGSPLTAFPFGPCLSLAALAALFVKGT
jgi:leader peptidase (prepilin peptidase)/N-methyltransferase|uniref:Prepilin peptidase n=1 Tax=Desulfobacca acetoxidans TaxID=60893 RepID=A0A7C5ELS6_9BACT